MSGGSRKGSESEEGAAGCPLVVPRHLCLGVPSQPCSPPGWLWLRRGTGLGSGRRPMGSWHRSLFWLSEAVSACSCSVCVLPLPLPRLSSGSVLMACTNGTPPLVASSMGTSAYHGGLSCGGGSWGSTVSLCLVDLGEHNGSGRVLEPRHLFPAPSPVPPGKAMAHMLGGHLRKASLRLSLPLTLAQVVTLGPRGRPSSASPFACSLLQKVGHLLWLPGRLTACPSSHFQKGGLGWDQGIGLQVSLVQLASLWELGASPSTWS